MAYLNRLLAEKDPSLMSVTIHSHPFLSFASKIMNAKQPGLTLLNLVDVLYKKRSRKGKQALHVAPVFLTAPREKRAWENQRRQPPRELGQVSRECRSALKTAVNHEGILRLQSRVSCIQLAEVLLPELVIVRHLATHYT